MPKEQWNLQSWAVPWPWQVEVQSISLNWASASNTAQPLLADCWGWLFSPAHPSTRAPQLLADLNWRQPTAAPQSMCLISVLLGIITRQLFRWRTAKKPPCGSWQNPAPGVWSNLALHGAAPVWSATAVQAEGNSWFKSEDRGYFTHHSGTGQVWKSLVTRCMFCSWSAGWLAPSNWGASPGIHPHKPKGRQQDTPETATLAIAQVLHGTGAECWLPFTARLVCDAAHKMPCQVTQLVKPLSTLPLLVNSYLVSVLWSPGGLNSINSAPVSSTDTFHLKASMEPLALKLWELIMQKYCLGPGSYRDIFITLLLYKRPRRKYKN